MLFRSEVGPGWTPYHADAMWADPDLDHAAQAMRQVADDPAEAHRRGKAARVHILRTRSMDAAAQWMRTQIADAYQVWRERGHGRVTEDGFMTSDVDSLAPLIHARHALDWQSDPTSPSRFPFAPILRRIIRRALNHSIAHERKVLGTLMHGVGEVVKRLDQRLDQQTAAHIAHIDTVQRRSYRQLAALAARLDRLERAAEERQTGRSTAVDQ